MNYKGDKDFPKFYYNLKTHVNKIGRLFYKLSYNIVV